MFEFKFEGLSVGILGIMYVVLFGDDCVMIGLMKEYDVMFEDCVRFGVVDDVDDERFARVILEFCEFGVCVYLLCVNWEFLCFKYGVCVNLLCMYVGVFLFAGFVYVDGRRCWFVVGFGARGFIYYGFFVDWFLSVILDDDINVIFVDVCWMC